MFGARGESGDSTTIVCASCMRGSLNVRGIARVLALCLSNADIRDVGTYPRVFSCCRHKVVVSGSCVTLLAGHTDRVAVRVLFLVWSYGPFVAHSLEYLAFSQFSSLSVQFFRLTMHTVLERRMADNPLLLLQGGIACFCRDDFEFSPRLRPELLVLSKLRTVL